MATPSWNAPTAGLALAAANITQFLGTHQGVFINQGTVQASGPASSSGTVQTQNAGAKQYIDQPFATAVGQTTLTRIELTIAYGSSPGVDTTIGLYADAAGVPTGTALASLTLPLDFLTNTATLLSLPLNATGLVASTKYHIVIAGVASSIGDAFSYGATTGNAYQTSATGVGGSWAAGAGTLLFNTYAGTDGVLRNTFEDSGARWTALAYGNGTGNPPTLIREYTGALRSVRTPSYASGALVGIA